MMTECRPRLLFEKVWDSHVAAELGDGAVLLYIDRHLVNEVTSPQAFEGLRTADRKVRRHAMPIAVAEHNVPTDNRGGGGAASAEPESKQAERRGGKEGVSTCRS